MKDSVTCNIVKARLVATKTKEKASDADLFAVERLEQELTELLDMAMRQKAAQAKAAIIDELLDINGSDPFPEKHYIAISAKAQTVDRELNRLDSQMERLPAIQEELATMAARQQIHPLIENAGAINPALVSQVIEQDIDAQVDDDGKLRVKMKDGKSIEGFLAEMPQSAEYRHLFGGGRAINPQQANNPYGVNPWLPVSHNLTMQGKIFKENPILAAKLQAEADQYKVKS
jgi:hypothetical protein